ncbi:MAG: glycosyltransferase family 4 protein [Candidatus Caenarcaniphilales bacterium]|nr:glycosyltransferase family 4 protein [Candidatus Caenarcaniphilales bacterium]
MVQHHAGKRIKVLMFGWEFPPFFAGGLGMACYGLVKSLMKQNVDITLVLPKSVTQIQEDGLNVFGADQWEYLLASQRRLKEGSSLEMINVPSTLFSPYASSSSPIDISILSSDALAKVFQSKQTYESALSREVYGPNLINEVIRYNQTAGSIAATLDFDVIHCHDWMTYGAGMIAKQVSGKPLIVHVHATEYDRAPYSGNSEVHHLERSGCEYADWVVAVSHFTKETLKTRYGIDERKIEVVHNGINFDEIPLSERPRSPEAPRILFLGRVTYQKGPNYFLEAASHVLRVKPQAEFIIAGTGDMIDYLKARSVELGIADRITFTGMLKEDQVKNIYRQVDCFVLSSVSEPFGLTVLEALSHRLPVIISKQSGVSEVLRHVLRYDFWDVERLASLILSVITYNPLADELRHRALDDLHPVSWDQSAGRVKQLYERALSYQYAYA